MKKYIKQIIGHFFKTAFLLSNRKIRIIFMYHRVVKEMPEEMHDPHMFIKESSFCMHIKELSKYFQIVGLEDILRPEITGARLCAFTFDDGWLDNYEIAFPILLKNRSPATIFLPVIDIGTSKNFWFDHIFFLGNYLKKNTNYEIFIRHFRTFVPDWNPGTISTYDLLKLTEALKAVSPPLLDEIIDSLYFKLDVEPVYVKTLMDWVQINEMGEKGISFGSHGLTHSILTSLSKRMKRDMVFESLLILNDKSKYSIPFFSYPNGNWDSETVLFLKEAGYHGAVTTKRGCINWADLFLLNRIGLSELSSNTRELLWYEIFKAVIV